MIIFLIFFKLIVATETDDCTTLHAKCTECSGTPLKCDACDTGFKPDATQGCVDDTDPTPDCTTLHAKCTECSGTPLKCDACDTGFKPDATQGCVEDTDPSDSEIIEIPTSETPSSGQCGSNAPPGCKICSPQNPSQCLSCDSDLLFNETVNNKGLCQCINDSFTIEDGVCTPETTRCAQSAIDLGCSRCYLFDNTVCAECDSKKGFKEEPNEKNNKCECINSDFNVSNGICVEIFVQCQWESSKPVDGCTLCHSRRPSQCTECDATKGFVLNKASHQCECQTDGYIVNGGSCVPPTESGCKETEMIGCIKCTTGNENKCQTCDSSKGFKLNIDKCECSVNGYVVNSNGVCAPPADNLCFQNISIPGCVICSENVHDQCSYCDTSLHFEQNPVNGICQCAEPYSLRVDGKCSDYKLPIDDIINDFDYDDVKEIPDGYITVGEEEKSNTLIVNTDKLEEASNFDQYKLYETQVSQTITNIEVNNNDLENVQLAINDRNNEPLNISIVSDQQIQLDTSKSNFPLNLPENSQKISINVKEGDSDLKIGSTENSESVNLGNVSVSSQKVLTLEPLTNVVLSVINFFGSGSKINVKNDGNTKATVAASKIYVQKGSTPELTNVEIKDELNMAPYSKLKINEGVNFASALFKIFKDNHSQPVSNNYFDFNNRKIEQSPRSIEVLEMIENRYLDDIDDKIILIHFPPSEFNDTMCELWAEKVEGGKGECVKKDKNNNGDNSVYAYKTNTGKPPKDKGLSAGAIAGIVIACVVVVAAIIALLVYFLVIKKKNQSTTSTQGDSSIAI